MILTAEEGSRSSPEGVSLSQKKEAQEGHSCLQGKPKRGEPRSDYDKIALRFPNQGPL